MKRTQSKNHQTLSTDHTNSSNASNFVLNTSSDSSRACLTIESYNVFTDHSDIMLRILYSCAFETLCTLRSVSKFIHSLATQCCEKNYLSPLALKAMISISLIEFINSRKSDKFIFANEYTSMCIDRLNIIEWFKYIDLYNERNEPLANLSILQEELQVLAKTNKLILDWQCYEKMKDNDLKDLDNFISTNISSEQPLTLKISMKSSDFHTLVFPKPIQFITSLLLQDLLNTDNNLDELTKFSNLLLANNLSEEQKVILQHTEKLSLFITHGNCAEIEALLTVLAKPNTPLPQLKAIVLTIDEYCVFSLTEKNCPYKLTELYVRGGTGISLKLSDLSQLRKFHITHILEKATITLENLPNLIEINVSRLSKGDNKKKEGIIVGSLILNNLPKLSSFFIKNGIRPSARFAMENVPNVKSLKISQLPPENIFKKYFLNLTTLELQWFNAKDDLECLQSIRNLKQFIITNISDNDHENENDAQTPWLNICHLTSLEKLQIGEFSDTDIIDNECTIENLENLTELDLTNLGQNLDLSCDKLPNLKILRLGNILNDNIFGSTLRSDGKQFFEMTELDTLALGNINIQSSMRHLEFLSNTCLPKLKKLSFGDINAIITLPKNLSETLEEISFGHINALVTIPLIPSVKCTYKSILHENLIKYHPSDSNID